MRKRESGGRPFLTGDRPGPFVRRAGPLPRAGAPAQERAVNFDKIPENCIKLDKFTGFFDKFPKGEYPVNYCNKKSYDTNLSVPHSDTGRKSFSLPRICPHLR